MKKTTSTSIFGASYLPFIAIFLLLKCSPLVAQQYKEVSDQLGIQVKYGWDPLSSGGVSFADFNMDGWDDLTLTTSSGDSLHFYQNNQDGTFTKLPALVPETGKARGIVWADYDNDGDRDLLVCNEGSSNHLYENIGNLNLVNVTESAGLPGFLNDDSFGASFCDYNNDGWLDIYIMNRTGQHSNQMFKNNGDKTFSNASFTTFTHDSLRLSFTASFFDLNMDGWQDFHIAQDKLYMRNSTYKNNGNGTFSDVSVATGTNAYIEAMCVAVGDYDNDGDQDFYITNTNTKSGNILYRNNGNQTFTDVAVAKNIHIFSTSWGANFFDYDNDLDEDLFVCLSDSFVKYNRLFENDGLGNFTDVLAPTMGLPNDTVPCFSTAYGDFDNNGQLDIVAHSTTPFTAKLWQADMNHGNNWLKIRLQGTTSNRDGVGALLELYLGGQKYIRYVHCGDGYISQNSFTKHFGMGGFTAADSLIVKWLGGNIDKVYNVAANQTVFVKEGTTVGFSTPTLASSFSIKKLFPNPSYGQPVQMIITSEKTQNIHIQVVNNVGQIIFNETKVVHPGENLLSLPPNLNGTGSMRCIIRSDHQQQQQEVPFLKF